MIFFGVCYDPALQTACVWMEMSRPTHFIGGHFTLLFYANIHPDNTTIRTLDTLALCSPKGAAHWDCWSFLVIPYSPETWLTCGKLAGRQQEVMNQLLCYQQVTPNSHVLCSHFCLFVARSSFGFGFCGERL